MTNITLIPLAPHDRERFILDNQEAFNYGALQEFGRRDDHFEEDGKSSPVKRSWLLSMVERLTGSCRTASRLAASLSR